MTAGQPEVPCGSEAEAALLRRVEADIRACLAADVHGANQDGLIPKWREIMASQPARFVDDGGVLNTEAVREFRRRQVFVTDNPGWDPEAFDLRSIAGGGRRGDRRMLRECLDVALGDGHGALLRRHPCSDIGRPYVLRDRGYAYTYRWLKHICFLGTLSHVIGDRMSRDFVLLDIGSSYGIFSGIVKREWPQSAHVLVDFPEQLFLAHYFLGRLHPGARIAGVADVLAQPRLTREWVAEHDFTLVPCTHYERLEGGVADLVSNFASLGEMSRAWFDTYLNSPPVEQTRFLFLVNRFESAPTYDTDLTILDYPLRRGVEARHFRVSPIFSHPYRYPRTRLFFSAREIMMPYFEYIGERIHG